MIIHPKHQEVVKLYSLFTVYQEVRMLQSLFEWLEMFKNWRASECGKLMWIIPPKIPNKQDEAVQDIRGNW